MYFFFHLFTGIILGFLASDLLHDRRWLIPCAVGAILPDLIDKPIGYLLFPATIGYGRIYSHALIAAILVIALGGIIWKIKQDPGVLAVGVGILSHQILDMMWLQPKNWYYPLLGPFRGTMIRDYFLVLLLREVNNPYEIVLGICFIAGILVFFYRNRIIAITADNNPLVSATAAAGALLLCVLAGILIGLGLAHHVIALFGWSRPDELIIGGTVIALSAFVIWRWRNKISRV